MHGLRTIEAEVSADIVPVVALAPPTGPEFADVAPRLTSSIADAEAALAIVSHAPEPLIQLAPVAPAPPRQTPVMSDPLVSPAHQQAASRPRIAIPSGW